MTLKTLRTCKNGHQYAKSTDCPTCPICEKERKPENGFLSKLSAPARRALENQGITTLEKLATFSKKEVLKLHGIGPSTIPILVKEMESKGLTFRL